MKNELGRKVKTKFVGLRAKTSSLLIDDGNCTYWFRERHGWSKVVT